MSRTLRNTLIVLCVLAVAALPLLSHGFIITLMNYIGIYTLITLGLVLLTGCGGITSFGQAAFVGIGAYATAYLTTAMGWSPWLGLIAGIVLTSFVALVLGYITLHLGGHYLPLTTIAWGVAIYLSFGNFEALGSYGGIADIPSISLFGFQFDEPGKLYYIIWLFCGLSLLGASNLLRSRQGRAIRALRGGKGMSESLGIDVFWVRLCVFVLAAALAGIAGWLYAHMTRFVSPAPFSLQAGIEYLLMAVLGGAGTIAGAVVGAASVALAKNWLQDLLPYLSTNSANLEIVVFGCLFILLLHKSRSGIVPLIRQYLPVAAAPAPPPGASEATLPKIAPPERGSTLLKVDGLTKRFGGLVAVDNVSFEVKAGTITALIGPNGAGKSTSFNLITGALHATSGTVTFAGHKLSGIKPHEVVSLGMARTFQHVKLRPTMTLLENVMLGSYRRTRAGFVAGALKLDGAEERAVYHEAMRELGRVGLADKAHELAGNLALGQQRVLEVARALAAAPLLIMLDEPAAGLRSLEKKALAELLRSLRADGMTILLVEHDMDFVMSSADRVVVLDFGKKLAEGVPAEIQANPAVQEAYLGERRMTAMLEAKGVCVSYGKLMAVKDVSFSIEEGKIVTIIGPNGAGKTTLLKALIGQLPCSGDVTYGGDNIHYAEVESRVERGIVLVPETRELFTDMIVSDNLLLGAYVHRRNGQQVKDDMERVYDLFPRLRERRVQLAGTLSGGERQMLALGRALMGRPKLLMLDEPSLGLAPLIVREIFRIIARLGSEGVTMLLVEQNARAALETADYGYVLESGEVVHQGKASDLMRDPRVMATYLGKSAG